jgi:uncharacterized repeat protein (TIGR03803 family)
MIDLNHSRNLAVRPRAGCFHDLFPLPVLIAALGWMLAGQVRAQTFTTAYSFTATSTNSSGVYTNRDGSIPHPLILSGKTLYGTTYDGGSSGSGTVFKVNTDGSGFTTLRGFAALNTSTNVDGANPVAGLSLSSDTLYGTTYRGGNSGNGTVFKVNTDGTGFTTLYSFTATSTNSLGADTNGDGAFPSGLVVSSNTLYGTASYGGSSGGGTVFALNTDGTGFTTTYSFTGGVDGWSPNGGLNLTNNTLYGTAYFGGNAGNGTVFKVNADGTGFTNLYTFTALIEWGDCGPGTNSDGTAPTSVILSGNTLYGTTYGGGTFGGGTVFKVNTDGTGFSNLYNASSSYQIAKCLKSGGLSAGLVLWGNSLFGTTPGGGLDAGFYNLSTGTVFGLNTDGTGFTNLHIFSGIFGWFGSNFDGGLPSGGLILSGNTLYGTTSSGGTSGNGTIFSISFPQLTINPSGANIILSWPIKHGGLDYTGFTLQSTTNLVSPVWTTNLPAPVVANQQNTVTNPMSGTQQFFRLSQ